MEVGNNFSVTGFILLGFSDNPALQAPIVLLLLLIYLSSLLGNSMVFFIICLSPQLHKPMYYFLLHMSFLDICSTSVTLPKAIAIHVTDGKFISSASCFAQVYFFMFFVSTEIMLLTAMGYDRYLAICNPLRYDTVMSRRMCTQLATISWTIGILDAMPHTVLMSNMSYCGHQNLDHFFCDVPVLTQFICSDNTYIIIATFTIGVGLGVTSSIITLASYVFIISTILGIRSAAGRHQAFSTCSAHLTALLLFYGTVFGAYLKPTSMYSRGQEKIFSLLYAGLIPMLNPVIYTLRNKEVKKALKQARRIHIIFTDNKVKLCTLL